jgi:hypothetical protein
MDFWDVAPFRLVEVCQRFTDTQNGESKHLQNVYPLHGAVFWKIVIFVNSVCSIESNRKVHGKPEQCFESIYWLSPVTSEIQISGNH